MELGPRDRLSQAFVKELEKGRTIKGPYGDVVHLDLRHLGEEKINAKLPMVRELCVKYENIDPVHEMIPVRPVQHYMMGGVHTDTNGATPLKGLVRGGRGRLRQPQRRQPAGLELAQRDAGVRRARRPGRGRLREHGLDAVRRIRCWRWAPTRSGESKRNTCARPAEAKTFRRCARRCSIRWKPAAGIYRVRASLAEAADKIGEMQERYKAISMEDHSRAFNTQLIAALELGFLLDVAETILQCGLQREESRGAHQRTDFPDRDDKKFLAHSLVSRGNDGRPVVSYLPVTITRWPPGKRVYGEQSTDGGHDSH